MAYIESLNFLHPVFLQAMPYAVTALVIFLVKYAPKNITQTEVTHTTTYIHPMHATLLEIKNGKSSLVPTTRIWLTLVYSSLLLVLALTTLAGPYYNGKSLPPPAEYRDIVFIVDNEVSMVLKDYIVDGQRVDRLTMVKSTLTHLTEKLRGNRMSIIAFSENAYTLAPLTLDTNLLKKMIRRVELTMTGRVSDPAKALQYTLSRFSTEYNQNINPPTLVLITAVNRTPRDIDPRVIAEQISAKGYKLHVIAIGANTYKARQENISTLIYEPANYELLKQISTAGNGQFYKAQNTRSLRTAIDEIQKSDKQKINAEPVYEKILLYQWPILLITLLVLGVNIRKALMVRGLLT